MGMQTNNSTPHKADTYDQQIYKTIPYYNCFHYETIQLVQTLALPPKRWLDTGCGTGTLVEQASSILPSTKFIMADPSESMLKQAREKLSHLQNRVSFMEAAGTEMLRGSMEEPVDVITAIQAHHYLSREGRRQATETCFYLLNQGGLYITFENIRPMTVEGTALGKTAWANFQIEQGKTPEAAAEHMKRFDKEYFPITIAEHIQLMKDVGFRTVEMLWYSKMQAGFYGTK